MRRRFFGIYGKMFFYTMLILAFVILVMFTFFSDQIKSVVEATQQQQIRNLLQPLITQTNGKSDEEIASIAKSFYEKNASFEFSFQAEDGRVIYQTENFVKLPQEIGIPPQENTVIKGLKSITNVSSEERLQFMTFTENGMLLNVSNMISGTSIYNEVIKSTLIAFALIFMVGICGAAFFAWHIAKPIQKIAGATKKMANLEPVSAPFSSKDEIGELASDVYKMYKKLKTTIRQLECEIEREKEMEENQRYFFSAASHELKTPIAATSALLEGMLENVIDPSEYPRYLRECLKMMSKQSNLVSEILEIVSLSNDTIPEKKTQVNLNEYITNALLPYLAIAEQNEQNIDVDIPKSIFCVFDVNLLGKAFSNIVMNAIQNTPEKGKIQIFAKQTPNNVRLCVLNNAVSIPNEMITKLFEPFYRADEARNREQGRSGLGLTIVKKTMELMKVPYALENTNEGVLFRMDLPS
jgi:two-component system sensor histidine kinase VanS